MTTTKNQNEDSNKKSIFLSITYDGTIKEFNKECEKITGYLRSEVLNKNIKDFLIPQHHLKQWNQLIALEKQQKTNATYDIDLQNKQKQQIPMSVTILSLNKKNDLEESFLLIGNEKELQTTPFNNIIINQEIDEQLFENNSKKTEKTQKNFLNEDITLVYDTQEKNTDAKTTNIQPTLEIPQNNKKKYKKRIRIKKLTTKKEKENQKQQPPDTKNKATKPLPLIQPFSDTGILNVIQPIQPIQPVQPEKPNKSPATFQTQHPHSSSTTTDETQISTQQPLAELIQHYDILHEKINKLEQKEKQLEEKNQCLEQTLQQYNIALNQNNKNTSPQIKKQKTLQEKKPKKQLLPKLPNPLSLKKMKNELKQKIKQLDEKEKQLHQIESHLLKDKKQYNKQIAQMADWKEKLLCLESEIEKRRIDLLEHETLLTQKIKTSCPQESKTKEKPEIKQQLTIDTIQQSAAVIQRGIIKQINASFSKFLGFKDEELVEKSLFDFVASEGLSDIEKYYLKRLKGMKESHYETIFTTKTENKIQVTVKLQPTEYNGDKAEIAIISSKE